MFLDNGEYLLKVPFSDSRELCMDILRHGASVKVLEPIELVNEVIK
jgi:predicted DNA-binding transcriptional regulator YafY